MVSVNNMNLLSLEPAGKAVFVGDTHGDLDASQRIIQDYLKPRTRIFFLGDFVDRGSLSKQNIDYLLEQAQKYPRKIYLSMGNHEAYPIKKFDSADFWENLSKQDIEKYSAKLSKLPLVFSIGDIIEDRDRTGSPIRVSA